MLLAGDEMGRTQRGNNNAYCQDNEISWLDWDLDAAGRGLIEFVAALTALRRKYPALRPRHHARPGELRWLKPQGGEMAEEDWRSPFARCLGMLVPGAEDLLLLLNAHHDRIEFTLPGTWRALLDTTGRGKPPGETYPLQGRSLPRVVTTSHPGR